MPARRRSGTVAVLVGALLVGSAIMAGPPLAEAATNQSSGGARIVLTDTASGTSIYRKAATFTGPITTGHIVEPESALPTGLAAHGYVEHEFFASGTAHAFRATSHPSDGKWTIEPTTSATYRTRILVRRPSDPARFSGTVVVEWFNESEGESDPDWDYLNPELMDAGDIYVGVTVQALGVEGGTAILGSGTKGLVAQEPSRYGSLHHPGDQYALDIFDQIGLGLHSAGSHLFGSLHPRHYVAVGESQSAFYLTTFADALQPLSHTFNGIFIHSRGGSGATLDGAAIPTSGLSGGLRIRTDLGIPVFMFETQTDLIELGYASAQQPNTKDIRTWEVAGTSHADEYLVGPDVSGLLGCMAPINDGPQHVVVQAAFAAFSRWVVHGTPPPSPPPFKLSSTHPATLALDHLGNVIGGVRTPAVDVPVSTLTGAGPAGSSEVCQLFGSATAFSPQQLVQLYGTKANYLSKYTADLDRAIAGGYLLAAEKPALIAQAQQVAFPEPT
jgi:hypothetical protein